MGGPGSGRTGGTDALLDRMTNRELIRFDAPVEELILPNYSGLKPEVLKTSDTAIPTLMPTGATPLSGGVTWVSGGVLYSDSANLYWDDTNNRLSVSGPLLISSVGNSSLDSQTSGAIQLPGSISYIYFTGPTANNRKLIGFTSNSGTGGIIFIGQGGTGIVDGINIIPGNSGNVLIENNINTGNAPGRRAVEKLEISGSLLLSGSQVAFKINTSGGIAAVVNSGDLVGKNMVFSGGILVGYS